MTLNTLFAKSQIHHIALRVADTEASKAWFLTKVDFHVDREFSFGGMDFVWLCPKESNVPVVELIGGGVPSFTSAARAGTDESAPLAHDFQSPTP